MSVERPFLLSVLTTCYNETKNLPILYERLCEVFAGAGIDWEFVLVDDHSRDETFGVIRELAQRDPRVRGVRLSRNVGSHAAVLCGLDQARGDCVVAVAADLQHPPEVVPQLVDKWGEGFHVVWAARASRPGDKRKDVAFAQVYYFIMRHIVGIQDMPATGADFFLIDRKVVEALRQFPERNVSLLALITWMGFRQTVVYSERKPRLHGKSGWSLEKKLKLVVDSITSFTYLPIRLMSYCGFLVALLGFIYAGLISIAALSGRTIQGWSSLMVVVLVVGGIQMLMFGILGEYLWRSLDESRQRPRYLIEDSTEEAAAMRHAHAVNEASSPKF